MVKKLLPSPLKKQLAGIEESIPVFKKRTFADIQREEDPLSTASDYTPSKLDFLLKK
jgi:hypothetical protein